MSVDTEGIQRLQVVNWDTANCLIMIGDSIYSARVILSDDGSFN